MYVKNYIKRKRKTIMCTSKFIRNLFSILSCTIFLACLTFFNISCATYQGYFYNTQPIPTKTEEKKSGLPRKFIDCTILDAPTKDNPILRIKYLIITEQDVKIEKTLKNIKYDLYSHFNLGYEIADTVLFPIFVAFSPIISIDCLFSKEKPDYTYMGNTVYRKTFTWEELLGIFSPFHNAIHSNRDEKQKKILPKGHFTKEKEANYFTQEQIETNRDEEPMAYVEINIIADNITLGNQKTDSSGILSIDLLQFAKNFMLSYPKDVILSEDDEKIVDIPFDWEEAIVWNEFKDAKLNSDFNTIAKLINNHPKLSFVEEMRLYLNTSNIPESSQSKLQLSKRKQIALIIGIDNYQNMPVLKNATADAKAIAEALHNYYGFKHITELYDNKATKANILDNVRNIVDSLKGDEDILIYFAGHGHFDSTLERGYWVPVDAQDETDFLPNSEIHDYIKAMDKKKVGHIFLIADSCFSGTFLDTTRSVRGLNIRPVEADKESVAKYLEKLYASPSRQALTSGSNEPVPDSGAEGHSVFTYYLLQALEQPEYPAFTATELSAKVQQLVGYNSDQTPRIGIIKFAGHAGGEFVFVKEK